MNAIVFAPHGDDETLFAAYTCIRERAHVIVCSVDADPHARNRRSLETTAAIRILGCSHHEWPVPADEMEKHRKQMRTWMESWDSQRLVQSTPSKVYAPAIHSEGHEQHNLIGELAVEVFGHTDKLVQYCTYAPRGQRQKGETEVIPTSDEIALKFCALACYRSQIEHPATRPWFHELLDPREWLA